MFSEVNHRIHGAIICEKADLARQMQDWDTIDPS